MVCPSCLREIPDLSPFCNLCGKSTSQPQQETRSKSHPILWVALAVLGLFLFVRYFAGSSASSRMVAAAVHTSITLRDETQNVAANHYLYIPVQPPYSGSLDVSLSVLRGNPLDVFLVNSSDMDALKRTNDWRVIQGDVNFGATKTTTYHRTAPITQGSYFLILRDTSLGILSQSSSDVSVKMVLNP